MVEVGFPYFGNREHPRFAGTAHESVLVSHTGQKPFAVWVDMVAWSMHASVHASYPRLSQKTGHLRRNHDAAPQ